MGAPGGFAALPDFASTRRHRQSVLVTQTIFGVTSGPITRGLEGADYLAFWVSAAPLNGLLWEVIIKWYFAAEQTAANLVATTTYVARGNQYVQDVVPIQGASFSVLVRNIDANAAAANLRMWTLSTDNAAALITNSAMLAVVGNAALGAGAAVTDDLIPVTTGTATLTATQIGAAVPNWHAAVWCYFSAIGVPIPVAYIDSATAGRGGSVRFDLPAYPCFLQFVNHTAAPAGAYATVILAR